MCFKKNNRKNRQGRPVKAVNYESDYEQDKSSSDSDEYAYSIKIAKQNPKTQKSPRVHLKLNNITSEILVDTGASINIIDQSTYERIGLPKVKRDKGPKLLPYGGGNPLKTLGTLKRHVETKTRHDICKFHLVEGNYGSLIGFQSASDLGLVQVINKINRVNNPIEKYQHLFNGIGKLKNKTVKLHINKDVKPVALRHKRTPFHLRDKVKAEIKRLVDEDIIEKVENEPTPWISPIVTPPKKGGQEIRLCVDMREPNKAIVRERHIMPTLDELVNDLNQAKIFSKLDLTSGYHQLELDKDSRYITTFSTHVGIYQYKRLNFGISSASEVFQEAIRSVIRHIPGAKNISDDIIVYGRTQEEHDKALEETFDAISSAGLTLNKKKCQFNQKKISFFGVVFSPEGISPDPEKVKAIKEAKPPKTVKELRSFLGITSYSSRFIPNYATVCEPLRKLTHKDVPWEWNDNHEKTFERLKEILSDKTTIAYFNQSEATEVIVDASPVGLGAVLTQKNKVVAYASRALTAVESRYSQTEREALAVVWACEHLNVYPYGSPEFTVITDHKPLEKIWTKPKPTLRIERWGIRLQPYKFKIKYRPGEENTADYLSRHPREDNVSSGHEEKVAEYYVNFICETSIPKAMSLDEIKSATMSDKTVQKAIEFTRNGQWHKINQIEDDEIDILELNTFRSLRDELTVHTDNILLRGTRIVMPKDLRIRAIKIAHEGHQGITKTKSFIRSKVWFPNINEEVEKIIGKCVACQAMGKPVILREPLKMSPLPSRPWERLSADFCGPLPSGDYLFVIIDEYSRYPVVEIVRSVSANATIPVLDKVISMFGIPKIIKTDNGSPSNSKQFAQYAEHIGFEHRKITPHWPRANAQAEAFNKPLMKTVNAASIDQKNWKQEMQKFLRQYRATAHSTTGLTPYKLLFNRDPNTKLPTVINESLNKNDPCLEELVQRNDDLKKTIMKSREDKRIKAANTSRKCIGDYVILENEQRGKTTPIYNPKPYKIVSKKGSMVTAKRGERNVTRNSSRFKTVTFNVPNDPANEEDEEDNTDSIPDETPSTRTSQEKTVTELIDNEAKKSPKKSVSFSLPLSIPIRRSERIRKTPAFLRDYCVK